MNDRAINVDRVFDLAGAICDDCASENDCAELDSIVVADETSGRRYWDYCRMHVMLGMEARVHQALQKVRERDNLDLAALTPWECDALLAALPPAASPVSSPVLGFLSTTLHGAVGFLLLGLAGGVSDRNGDVRDRAVDRLLGACVRA